MAVQEMARRVGVSVVGLATAAALIAGCSSSSGGGSPANNNTASNNTTSSGASTNGGGGSSTSSSNSNSGGQTTGLDDAFCTGFKNSDLQGLSNASSTDQVVKAWDKYAKDAPSAIKSQVQDIDHYLHALVNHDVSAMEQEAQKVGTDAATIGTYYAAHCHS